MNSSQWFPVRCKKCGEHSTSLSIAAGIVGGIFSTIAGFATIFVFFFYGIWAAAFSLWLIGIILMPLHLFGRAKPVGTPTLGAASTPMAAVFHGVTLILILVLWKASIAQS